MCGGKCKSASKLLIDLKVYNFSATLCIPGAAVDPIRFLKHARFKLYLDWS